MALTRAAVPPAEVRAALLTDYIFHAPPARGALANAAAGGHAHLLAIGPAAGAPAVHGTEMHALVGQEQPGRSPEQAGRDTRIRDIVLDFVTGEQTRLWPAVTDRPTSGSAGNLPYEPISRVCGCGSHRLCLYVRRGLSPWEWLSGFGAPKRLRDSMRSEPKTSAFVSATEPISFGRSGLRMPTPVAGSDGLSAP